MTKEVRKPYLWESLLCLLFLVVALSVTLIVLGGDPQIPLIAAAIFTALIALRTGVSWKDLEKGGIEGITTGLKAIVILLVIGMIIGAWMLAGVVPAMVYYGLMLLNPSIFLIAICLIACVTSLATGSSWTTAGTVGVAGMGIAVGMGIPLGLAAGAIVSGAYFGDKMSPLSDTTNLAPAVTGVDLFDHIRHMVYTVTPSLIISLILFGVIGATLGGGAANVDEVNLIMSTLRDNFTINPLLLLPAVLVIAMVIFRIPALPGLIGGVFLGGLFAFIFQGAGLADIVGAVHYGFEGATGVEVVDDILSRGGLDSMLWTISLVLCALFFGGIMEKARMLEVIVDKILTVAKSTGSLVLSAVLTCIFVNFVTADQYLAIVLPGRMYTPAFKERKLHPKNLSRIVEDAGTMTSALVPWGTCGAFMAAALGVPTFVYAPFAFLLLLNPLVSIFYGFTGITMEKLPDEAVAESSN